jgi:glycosyltransferase involved in cell wall biosynthesis
MLPYREVRNGIPVLRLPLWIGRETAVARYRQELSFMSAQFAALPALSRPDVLVSASPSFPALLPAIVNTRARHIPWILWLLDILPDGAAATGIINDAGAAVRAARRLERAAYKHADRIVVISEAFTRNLSEKGVPSTKIELVYPPATRTPQAGTDSARDGRPVRLLSMGNIGHSQGLAPLVAAFERSEALVDTSVDFVITGSGVAAAEVSSEIVSDRVKMLGVVDGARLEAELQSATVALVSQRYGGAEFNIPSKMMNFMTYGLPILAAVDPDSEVARIVDRSGAGWVVDSSEPDAFPHKLAEILRATEEIQAKGQAAQEYAQIHFSPQGFAKRFDDVLIDVMGGSCGSKD